MAAKDFLIVVVLIYHTHNLFKLDEEWWAHERFLIYPAHYTMTLPQNICNVCRSSSGWSSTQAMLHALSLCEKPDTRQPGLTNSIAKTRKHLVGKPIGWTWWHLPVLRYQVAIFACVLNQQLIRIKPCFLDSMIRTETCCPIHHKGCRSGLYSLVRDQVQQLCCDQFRHIKTKH